MANISTMEAKNMNKKILKFLMALIAAPVYIPYVILSLITLGIIEITCDYPDYDHYIQWHRNLIRWYIFE